MHISPVKPPILVVDDSKLKRMLAVAALKKAGHTTIEAISTNDGLKKLIGNPDIRLGVVDFEMPDEHGGNGGLFARKALCMNPRLKLILHSTNVGTGDTRIEEYRYLFYRHTNTPTQLPNLVSELSTAV